MRTLTRCPLLFDPAHEAKSLARDRTDQVLLFAVVTDRLAGEIDVARECRFRDDSPGPDGRQDVILADHTLAVLHQIHEKVEDLRSNRNQLGPTHQFAPLDVERIVSEQKLHVGTLFGGPSRNGASDCPRPGPIIKPNSTVIQEPGKVFRPTSHHPLRDRSWSTRSPNEWRESRLSRCSLAQYASRLGQVP